MPYTKDLREIALTKETVRGTVASVATGDWIPVMEWDVAEEVTKKENISRVGTMAAYEGDRVVTKRYSGTLKAIADRRLLPRIVMGILGTVNTTANTPQTGVHTHTFTRSDVNNLPSYTFSTQDPAEGDNTYARGVFKSLKLNYVIDDYLIYDAEFDATTKASGTFTSSYSASNSVMLPWMASVKLANDVAGLAGASNIVIQQLELEMLRTSNFVGQIGNQEASEIVSGVLDVKGKITLTLSNATYRDLAQGDNTYRALEILLTGTSTTVGTSTNPSFRVRLPKISFRNFTRAINDEFVSQEIEFIALRDNSNGDVEVRVINDVAAY